MIPYPTTLPKYIAKIHRYSYTRKLVKPRFSPSSSSSSRLQTNWFDFRRWFLHQSTLEPIELDPLLQIHSPKLSNRETESSTGYLSRHFVRMGHMRMRSLAAQRARPADTLYRVIHQSPDASNHRTPSKCRTTLPVIPTSMHLRLSPAESAFTAARNAH